VSCPTSVISSEHWLYVTHVTCPLFRGAAQANAPRAAFGPCHVLHRPESARPPLRSQSPSGAGTGTISYTHNTLATLSCHGVWLRHRASLPKRFLITSARPAQAAGHQAGLELERLNLRTDHAQMKVALCTDGLTKQPCLPWALEGLLHEAGDQQAFTLSLPAAL